MTSKIINIYIIIAATVTFSGCVNNPSNRTTKSIVPETKIEIDKAEFLGGQLTSWGVLASDGIPRLAGVSLPMSIIENSKNSDQRNSVVSLEMSDEIKNATFINHIDVEFSSQGLDRHPSLSFRVYELSQSEQFLIDCSGEKISDLLEGYKQEQCEPKVGFRTSSINFDSDPDHPTPYGRINLGYHQDKVIFIEPVISIDKLLRRESFTLFMPSIESQQGKLVPTTFTGIYKLETDSYDFSAWAFVDPSVTSDI